MATKVFFLGAAANVHRGNNTAGLDSNAKTWVTRILGLSQGASLNTFTGNTVAGATSGVELSDSGDSIEWISEPITADTTISGTITANLWCSESSMNANVAIGVAIYRMAALDGALTLIVRSTDATEIAITTRAARNFTTGMTSGSYTGVTLNRGDRLVMRVFGDDAGTMGNGFTFSFGFQGAAGVDGDSYVSFTENFTFETTQASTQQLFLTDTASVVDNAIFNTGWRTPGTVTSVDRAGGNAWSGTGNVTADDGAYAVANTDTVGTDYLRCQNFGITIPTGSVVRGALLEVTAKSGSGNRGLQWHLVGANGSPAGEDTGAQGGYTFPTSNAVYTHGGLDYYWKTVNEDGSGLATFTKAELEDVDWGVDLWNGETVTDSISIDLVRIKVFYAPIHRTLEMWTTRGTTSHTGGHSAVPSGWNAAAGNMCGAEDPTEAFTSKQGGGVQWVTRPLRAFTLGGMLSLTLRARENAARTGLKADVYIVSPDGQTWTKWGQGICNAGTNAFGELPTTETGLTVEIAGDDTAVTEGQRLGLRIWAEDTSADPVISLPQLIYTYSGPSGGAAGDSYLYMNTTLTEMTLAPTKLLQKELMPSNVLMGTGLPSGRGM